MVRYRVYKGALVVRKLDYDGIVSVGEYNGVLFVYNFVGFVSVFGDYYVYFMVREDGVIVCNGRVGYRVEGLLCCVWY